MNKEYGQIPQAELEKTEKQKFFTEIKSAIFDTFPFESETRANQIHEAFDSLEPLIIELSSGELLQKIRDIIKLIDESHTNLTNLSQPKSFGLLEPIKYEAGEFWLADKDGRPKKIISINKVPITEKVEQVISQIPGGTAEWKTTQAVEELFTSSEPQTMKLELSDGEIFEKQLISPTEGHISAKLQSAVQSKLLTQNIGYLCINSWNNKIQVDGRSLNQIIQEKLDQLQNMQTIIIDVRTNSGGDDSIAEAVASRFTHSESIYAIAHRKKSNGMTEQALNIAPAKNNIKAKPMLLIGPQCLSSNESFTLMMKNGAKAIIVGETTGGGSGNPKAFDLNLGDEKFKLNVSRWNLYQPDGQPIERTGITPDYPVSKTEADIIGNKDPALDLAVKLSTQTTN